MRTSIRFSLSFIFLFGFWQSNLLLSHDAVSNGFNFSNQKFTSPDLSTSPELICDTPTGLSTTYITETSATFNWSTVSGAISYSVQTRLPGGSWSFAPGSPYTNTSVTIYGLIPATTYEWRVRANCNFGEVSAWTAPMSFTTGGTSTCNPPDVLITTNITQTTATWDWSPVSGAVSYSVQWRFAGGTWHNLNGGPWSNTILNVGGLNPGTAYEWRVRSNCPYGMVSPWSLPDGFTTLGSTCNTPQGLTTTNISESSATFNWSSVPGAQSYSVQIRLPNGYWTFISGSPFYNNYATVNNLSPGTSYEWRVRTNCSYGQQSNWSPGMFFTTIGSQLCDAPEFLYTTNITQTTATWDWSSVSGAVSYSVQWRYAGGTWHDLNGGPWISSILHVGGLLPGTAYEWRVRSNCTNGLVSEWSIGSSFYTLGNMCNTPTGQSTTNITETSATFSWTEVPGAQNYSVQIRLPNGYWSFISGSPFSNTSATVYNLNPGTTYEWRVRANCGYNSNSNWSPGMLFTTGGSSSCNAPETLVTINIGSTTATWDWSPVSGAINYSVQWRFAGGTWHTLPGGPWSGTILNIGGLIPGTTYEWRVRSNCSFGEVSEWSAGSIFTTLDSSCSTPTGLTTTNITETSATFTWSIVAGAQSYSVQTRIPNGVWNFLPGSPFMNTTATANGLNPGTTYEWRVRANCNNGEHSNWTDGVTFTTSGSSNTPENDNCGNAIVLTVNSDCMNVAASNVGATASSPSPMGWCPSNSYKDVWFRFTMPDNPIVTIRTTAGSLTDAVMEVYTGSCSNLNFIHCENDNNNGNGSDMPVITLSGGAGFTVWVRVWGYSGATGTFNICLFNYQSSNLVDDDVNIVELVEGEQLQPLKFDTEVQNTLPEDEVSPVVRLSPNPADDFLDVTYQQTKESMVTKLVLIDMSGGVVLQQEYNSKDLREFSTQLDVSTLAPGMYILQIITTTGILTEKVMIVDN